MTTDVGGRGGIQFAGRLIIHALRRRLCKSDELTVLSLVDSSHSTAGDWPATVIGTNGNRPRMAWRTITLARKPWDLIILGHINLSSLLMATKKFCRAPTVGLIYGLEAWSELRGMRRRGLRTIDHILYISEHSRQTAQQVNPWLAEISSSVCHLGLLPESAPDVKILSRTISEQVSQFRPPTPFALSIGRMSAGERYKGQEEMIRVWPRVNEHRPDLELVMIGEGDDRERLEHVARDTAAQVRFLGAVDNDTRDRYLRGCKCFCLPSKGEGFGLVYLEAMQAGKAVLAGNQDAGREVVVNDVTGRTVDAQNENQLFEGILDVSGTHSIAMGQAGRRRFDEIFCYEKFEARLIGTILTAMGTRTKPAIEALENHSSCHREAPPASEARVGNS